MGAKVVEATMNPSFRKVSRVGFIRRRNRARGLIKAIEEQRKGREAAFEDIPKYQLIEKRDIVPRLVISCSILALYILLVHGSEMPRYTRDTWGMFSFIASVSLVALVLGLFVYGGKFFPYGSSDDVNARFFFSRRTIAKMRSSLTRMQRWNGEIAVIQEEQKEFRQAYESLRREIEIRMGGKLTYRSNFASRDLSRIFYYEICLPNYCLDAEQEHVLEVFLNKDDWSFAVSVLMAYKENLIAYDT